MRLSGVWTLFFYEDVNSGKRFSNLFFFCRWHGEERVAEVVFLVNLIVHTTCLFHLLLLLYPNHIDDIMFMIMFVMLLWKLIAIRHFHWNIQFLLNISHVSNWSSELVKRIIRLQVWSQTTSTTPRKIISWPKLRTHDFNWAFNFFWLSRLLNISFCLLVLWTLLDLRSFLSSLLGFQIISVVKGGTGK